MADGNIEIKFTVEDAQAFRVWQRQQDQARKLKKELDALKAAGNLAGAQMQAAAGRAVAGLGSAIGALTGIGGAIAALQLIANQLRVEVANIRSQQSEAGNAQADLGDKLLGMIRKFGTSMTPMTLRGEVMKIAERTGQDPGKVARAAENAAAASGPQNEEEAKQVLQATEAVIQFYPELDESATSIVAKSVLDLMQRFKMSAAVAMGFMQKLDQAHHSTGALDLATHGVPAVSAVAAFGGSAEQSAALAAAMSGSKGMMDEGAESGTVVVKLAQELRERLPEERTGLKTTRERIDYLRAHPREAKAYLEGGVIAGKKHNPADFGRGKGRTYVEGLLGVNAETAPIYQEYLDITQAMGDRQSQLAAHQSGLQATSALPEVQQSELRRRLKSTSAGVQAANLQGGTAGISREGLIQILKDSGLSDAEQQAQLLKFEWNTSLGKKMPATEVARQLEQRALDLESPMVTEYGPAYGAAPSVSYKRDPSKATDQDRVIARRLRTASQAISATAPDAAQKQQQAAKVDLQPAQQAPIAPPAAPVQPQPQQQPKPQPAEKPAPVQEQQPAPAQPAPQPAPVRKPVVSQKFTEQQQQDNFEAAKQAKQDLIKLDAEIKSDNDFTAEERAAAEKRIERARIAGQTAAQPGATDSFVSPFMGDLNQQIQELIIELKNNTMATKNNTNKPATPAATGAPSAPRTPQASRRLDRRYSNIT